MRMYTTAVMPETRPITIICSCGILRMSFERRASRSRRSSLIEPPPPIAVESGGMHTATMAKSNQFHFHAGSVKYRCGAKPSPIILKTHSERKM